jgi:hypothetical protein
MDHRLQFVPRGTEDFELIEQIAERAARMDRKYNGKGAGKKLHHQMNIGACHASGNPLRLRDFLTADDFNFAHDVFGIDRHINRETGEMMNFFSPRFSARVEVEAA